MNITSTASAINSAIQSVEARNEYSVAMAGKALDAQKQEGAAALELIASATGKGQSVDFRA
jgi:hypothetical protein